ncbi:tudor domain-containing protein 15 [Salarias fasciatus]|uniref:tudor domain-containing protein 15 n=1 Tax=Salarias fasciatus TaxID=181472 RepID=UPI0011765869|nr:tudor domain-containing protein 15-like [Salarias fasciatus]
MDLKLTHLDWSPEAELIHFQGQWLTLHENDYKCLHEEIQRSEKSSAVVDVGELCLVQDGTSALWFRGRVQNRTEDLFEVYLIDHGNVLTVDATHMSSCSNEVFSLPAKVTCGFLANVLLLPTCPPLVMKDYLSSLVWRNVTGYVEATLSDEVLLLEVPAINSDLVQHGFGRHLDTDTFLFLVELLTEVPLTQNTRPCPELAIEKLIEQELTFKPSSWRGYKDLLPFFGPRLSCGTRAQVRVTAALNAGCFYCQVANQDTAFSDMSKKLNMIGCKNEGHSLTTEKINLLCSVKGKDGNWCRGLLPFLPVGSQVRVFLVDYGYFETVKVENIHRLPPDLCSTPFMAFPCLLSSLTEQDEAHRAQQLSLLKEGLLGGRLDMEIKSFDEAQHLYLVTINGVEDDHKTDSEHVQQIPTAMVEERPPLRSHARHKMDMASALKQTLEEEAINIGSGFIGYVEYAENPNNFWIRTQKRNKEFEEMMKEMADHFSRVKLDEDVLMNPELGTLCCAMYEKDMHFYRAVVTDILEQGVEVLFIDFGNIERVPYSLIKSIPEAFASKSAFAFCCSLANIIAYDVWTTKTSSFFRRAVFNKPLMVHVVEMKNSKMEIDLCEVKGLERQSVTELLISFARSECLHLKPESRKNRKGTRRKICPQHVSSTEQYQNREDGDSAKYIYTARELMAFQALSINSGVADILNQDLARTTLSKQQSDVFPETFLYSSYNLNPGCEEQVHVTHVNSQWEVYCQLDKNTEIVNDLEQKISEKSEKMMEDKTRAIVKNLCLAKYFDGTWYRAVVHATPSPSHFRVFYVDYGNVTISENSEVIFIPSDCVDLLHIPMQAMRFCLDSVPKGDLNVDVKEWLDDAILNKELRAVIRRNNTDGSFDVELFDGEVSINEKVRELSHSCSSQPKSMKAQDSMDAQEGEDVLDAQGAEGPQDTQDSEETQLSMEAQDRKETLDEQGGEGEPDEQGSEETQQNMEAQDSEDALGEEDALDALDGKEAPDDEERPFGKERRDGEEAQDDQLVCMPGFTSPEQNTSIPSAAEMENRDREGEPWRALEASTQRLPFAPVKAGKPYLAFAASVTSPVEFSVVLDELLFVMNQVSTMLDGLTEQPSPLPEADLVLGTCCLLKSDARERWYRAEIVHVDVTLGLKLVDHGQYERIARSDSWKLKMLPAEMRNLPRVTHSCVLRGVNPAGGDGRWTDEGLAFFQECLFHKTLQIFFREFVANTHWKVDVVTDGVHVAKQLVDAGHAQYVDALLPLRYRENSACRQG